MEVVQLNLLVMLQMFKQHAIFQNMEKYVVGMIQYNNVEINYVLILMELIIDLVINKWTIVQLMVLENVLKLLIVINMWIHNHVKWEMMVLVYGLMGNVIYIEIVLVSNIKHIKNVN